MDGGGPAGLTAAILLSRFHLSVIVLGEDTSRAAYPELSDRSGFSRDVGDPATDKEL